jgi:PAS domain S-box-containing protein
MEMANITYQDEDGNIKVKIDYEKCIVCGRCVTACKHDARYYVDDTEQFFNDLQAGIPISVIAAPSIRTNISGYKKLFTWLKQLGVNKIYDVSLGADICIWAHIKHIEKNNTTPMITQPCPAIVTYCELYRHDLLSRLSQIHSPMACTSIYLKHYQGINDRIAALSPCTAKKNEFEATNLAQYNITFAKLLEYLNKNNIVVPDEETEFEHYESGFGSLFPIPGGLKENIEYFTGKKHHIATAEGYNVYEKLDQYAETPENFLPEIFDVLNCSEGCNIGSACSHDRNVFEIEKKMNNKRKRAVALHENEYYESLYKTYDETFNLSHFIREYHPVSASFPQITYADIEKAFGLLGKTDYEKQNIDCGACGSETCHNMARKIALNVNIPINCIVKSMEEARTEHEENLLTHKQLADMERIREADERMKVMHELNQLQLTKLNLVVQASKIGLWDMEVVQDDPLNMSNPIIFSDEFRYMVGYSSEDDFPNILSSWADLLHPDDKETSLEAFEKHLLDTTSKTPFDIEYRLLKKNGKYAYYHASGETIRDKNGKPLRVAGALVDITETKNILFTAERQRVEAEAANKAKSSFLRTMSHEIRTPLNAILGITEIQLQNNNLDQNVREALEKIYTSGDLLLGIINDILDLSKIESGKMELTIAKYEIASLISDTVQLNVVQIGNKSIEFILCVDENVPSVLLGDELRIKQILNNLFSNAFKYSSSGTVRLSVSSEAIDGNDHEVTLVFSVSDTGQGMTKEQVNKLFDGYFRFNMKANRSTKGTGLGMSITRNLVGLMNGEISIKSEPGKGSVFTVRLPQGKTDSRVLGKEMAEDLNQFRTTNRALMKRVQINREPMPYGSVLIVDDVETNIYVARGLMSPYQLKIDSAASGATAIDKLKNGNVYDIIFMDHMMPEMDGIKTVKIIRGMGYKKPIVALTANAVAGQADIFLKNGFDDYISKPIDVRQLNVILNKLIRDIQPPEIIEAAKKNAQVLDEQLGNESQPDISPYLAEVFTRDALKTLAAIEAVYKKNDYNSEDNLRTYIINVHGIKNALVNIGKVNLSAAALKLEKAGREEKIEIIQSETPAFISALQAVVEELKPKMETAAIEKADEDKPFLTEMLHAIKMACADYDEKTVDNVLTELRRTAWSRQTNELLGKIAEQLLHSDFDEIMDGINKFMESEH